MVGTQNFISSFVLKITFLCAFQREELKNHYKYDEDI